MARQQGLPVDHYPTDEALGAAMFQTLSELAPLAQLGQQVQPHYGQFQEYLTQQGGQPAAGNGQPAAAEQGWTPPPQADPSWAGFCHRDPATGQYTTDDPALAHYAAKLNAAEQFHRDALGGFVTDPMGQLDKMGLKGRLSEMEQRLQDEIDNRLAGYDALQQQSRFIREQENRFIEHDPQGRPLQQPNGAPVLTAEGQRYADAMVAAQSYELPPDQTARLAQQMYEMQPALPAAPAAAAPAAPPTVTAPGYDAGSFAPQPPQVQTPLPAVPTTLPAPPTGEQKRETFMQQAMTDVHATPTNVPDPTAQEEVHEELDTMAARLTEQAKREHYGTPNE
jgi:hypothetical protein